jgi:hypothetical protein
MFLLVRKKDQIIVGTASNKIDESSCQKAGYDVFEIDDKEFSFDMLGKKIIGFKED